MLKINGSIAQIRDIEDTIRATKRYTEGLTMRRKDHPKQGDDMPSSAFARTLEVYLDSDFTQFDWDMDIRELINKRLEWLKSRATVLRLWYDYPNNRASLHLHSYAVENLCESIPDFEAALYKVKPFLFEREITNGEMSKLRVKSSS